MVLFLFCEENHTGDNSRLLRLFSWVYGSWSSRSILSCMFSPSFPEEFLGFKAPVSTLSVPVFCCYLLALQLLSRSNAELVWDVSAVWLWARSTGCVFTSTATWSFPAWLMLCFNLPVIVSLDLCVPCSQRRWRTWIHLVSSVHGLLPSCVLHLSTRAL